MKISNTILQTYKRVSKKNIYTNSQSLCLCSKNSPKTEMRHCNFSAIKNFIHKFFSKEVRFVEAQSFEEAKKLAKNCLGYNFKCFSYLEQVNLINKHFALIKNMYPQMPMPDSVEAISSLKGIYAKFLVNRDTGKTKIVFDNYPINKLQRNKDKLINCENIFYSSDKKLRVSQNISFDTKEKFEMLINKLHELDTELTLSDYYQISLTLRSLKNLEIQKQEIPLFFIKNILKSPQYAEKIKSQNIIIDLNKIEKASKEKQMELLLQLEKDLDVVYTPWISGFGQIIVHELTHLMCYKKRKHFFNSVFSTLKNNFNKKFESTKEIETAMQVSPYATTSPFEFVAEVFSHNFFGRKFSDEVLKLYEKYKGPKLLN